MTDARIGYGTTFHVGTDTADPPADYTKIAEVTNITPPPVTRDIIDATHMESPGGYREFIAGLKDGGECQVEMNFIPGNATQDLLIAMQVEDVPRRCRIEFPNGTIWSFMGWCTGFEPEAPVEDKMTATVTFKITGQPDFDVPS